MLGAFSTTDVTGYSSMAFLGGTVNVTALFVPVPPPLGLFGVSGGEAFAIEVGANATINKFVLGQNNDQVDLTALLTNATAGQLSSAANLFNPSTGPVKFTDTSSSSVTLSLTNNVNNATGNETVTLNAAPGVNFGNTLSAAENNIFNVLTTR